MERNLEVAAQECIDIANRIISMEQLEKPRDAYGAVEMLGKVGILPREMAERLATIAGFRNILVHEYLEIDPPWLRRLQPSRLHLTLTIFSLLHSGSIPPPVDFSID